LLGGLIGLFLLFANASVNDISASDMKTMQKASALDEAFRLEVKDAIADGRLTSDEFKRLKMDAVMVVLVDGVKPLDKK